MRNVRGPRVLSVCALLAASAFLCSVLLLQQQPSGGAVTNLGTARLRARQRTQIERGAWPKTSLSPRALRETGRRRSFRPRSNQEAVSETRDVPDGFYDQSLFDRAALAMFRSLVQRGVDYKSALPNYEGLKDEAKNYMVNQKAKPEDQQQMVVDVLKTIAGPFPALYKAIMPKLPTPLASFLTALFTPTIFGFLVGPSGLNTTRDGRPFQGVRVERCRFLAETGCKGLCVNMCKVPTERFFREEMGFPMEMRPNFQTCECTLSYGLEPTPLREDEDIPAACLAGCANLLQLGAAGESICGSMGAGDRSIASPAPAFMRGGGKNAMLAMAMGSDSPVTDGISAYGEGGLATGGDPGKEDGEYPDFVDAIRASEIGDERSQKMLKSMRHVPVDVPFLKNPVMTTVAGGWAETDEHPPFVFLHGFDSSLLEYRRLIPVMREEGYSAFSIDLLGWGFAQAGDEDHVITPKEKRDHLYQFWKQYIKKPMILGGASVGGAIALDFALEHPDAIAGLTLIDAQAYIDGVQSPPEFMMSVGLDVLRSKPLRQFGNVLTYSNTEKFATDDAMLTGRLHTFMPNWKQYNKKWMQGGGYSLSGRVKDVSVPTLILWGDNDKILGTEPAARFEQDIKGSKLVWVPECGHVPHLEQPVFTKDALEEFSRKAEVMERYAQVAAAHA